MTIKLQLYHHCLELVNQRLLITQKKLATLLESLASETKSSAGDKHETGRAMIQLEREQLGGQLAAIKSDQEILSKINPDLRREVIGLGSLVKTSGFTYFLSISVGKVGLNQADYYCISLQSPIGQLLAGKRVGDNMIFRDKEMAILELD